MHSHYPKMADTIRRSPFATQRRTLDEPIFWATLTIIVEKNKRRKRPNLQTSPEDSKVPSLLYQTRDLGSLNWSTLEESTLELGP